MRKLAWIAWLVVAALFLPMLNSACGTKTTNTEIKGGGSTEPPKETLKRKKLGPPD